MKYQKVGVGTAVLISKSKKILLIKRTGPLGAGTWAPPGGHIDFGESAIACAKRETKEEVGLVLKNSRLLGFTEDLFKKEKKHYITIWASADWKSGEVKKIDREFSEIGWFEWRNLPKPLFIPLRNFIQRKGYFVSQ